MEPARRSPSLPQGTPKEGTQDPGLQRTCTLRLGQIPIPKDVDTYHFFVVGATGSGKTYSYFAPLIAALMEKGEKGIIHCAKGEFTARFYNHERSRGPEQTSSTTPWAGARSAGPSSTT
ncbi:MAG: type IV secretion system DNA-binding domain-containing protein [bacterium]